MSGINTLRPNPGSTHKTKTNRPRARAADMARLPPADTRAVVPLRKQPEARIRRRPDAAASPHAEARLHATQSSRRSYSTINVSDLAKFEKGSKVGPQELVAAGVIRKVAKHGLRVLGDGKIDRALHVSAHYFTESAREKITKAGGTVEVISL